MKRSILLAAGLAAASAACTNDEPVENGSATAGNQAAGSQAPTGGAQEAGAAAEISGPQGNRMARAEVTQAGERVQVAVTAEGMTPGTYAVHVHQTGRCDPPAFQSAGSHWNPTNRSHGTEDPQGPHLGDLPNLEIDAQGRGSVTHLIDGASLRGGANPMLDADGAALVIHAKPDDYKTDPSGNSGDRIACGVVNGR